MALYWRWLALAIVATTAVGMTCAVVAEAQTPTKKAAAKKAKAAKAPEGQAEEGEASPARKAAKKKRQDPAEAQRAIDAAVKLLEAGKAEPAAQALSTVLAGGNLPPAIMAKALLYRGIAYRQQKLPAQAIADLTSALWLKGGLGESDRSDALRQRASAYQEAGLAESGAPLAPAVPSAARSPTRTASAAQTWGTETTAAAPPASSLAPAPQDAPSAPKHASSGWGLPNPFAGWFGSSTSPFGTSPSPQAAPQTTASIDASQPASSAPPSRPRTSAWTRNTEVHGSNPAPAVAAAAPIKPEGRFRIQVGMSQTQDGARALAAKVKREHGAALAAREPEIDQAVVGNMGMFYRVRVGPFATQQEVQAACALLKGAGLDCLVVAQ